MAPARNGGRPYGPRTIKLHTEPRTFLVGFDQRVLEEARDKSVPLLERMKFVAIFTSNLDEFFMIRVGSLYDMAQTDATDTRQPVGNDTAGAAGCDLRSSCPVI